MEPEELEFLAEKELICIIPTFTKDVMHFICGDVGPFLPGMPVRIPLWMAINLKEQQKCKIEPPHWMTVSFLEDLKEQEKTSRTFIKMPSEHYMIETKILLASASEDIPDASKIRTIIKDIWDIRLSKLRSSIDILMKSSASYAAIENLTAMEINSIRPMLPHALDQLYRLKKAAGISKSQSQNVSSYGMSHSRLSITPFKS